MSLARFRVRFVRSFSWIDLFLFLGFCFLIYALVGVAQEWAGPYQPKSEIQLGWTALLRYCAFSLSRVFLAYFLSLIFTLTYGYWAATSKRAEPILISLLDILQSVPVLGFMPGVVLALVSLFPHSNLGLELAAVLMVFTCEGWNMVFSFYSSLKQMPPELRELATLCRFKRMDVLSKIEIPYAMNGLLWNSMLSMAGGWFYLMVMESFTLGDKDFRLPGIGSYMAVAYAQRDIPAVLSGLVAMTTLIILVDRCLWAPLVVWSERFKFDPEPRHGLPPRSIVLDWLKRSQMLVIADRLWHQFKKDYLTKKAAPRRKKHPPQIHAQTLERLWRTFRVFLFILGVLCLFFGFRSTYTLLGATTKGDWLLHLRDTFLTLLRVTAAVVLGSLWTIPLGVFIGTNPYWVRKLQPLVQIVASFPAPMLFPILTYLLIRCGISIEVGAVVLMLFASQWYILFNVISGATLIPRHLFDVAGVFQVRGKELWRSIILPAIFPSLLNGWITAAGGAWNASIVSELVESGGNRFIATGIGASITEAAQNGEFARLAAGIITMVACVVLLNRFFWGELYRLAETRFKLE